MNGKNSPSRAFSAGWRSLHDEMIVNWRVGAYHSDAESYSVFHWFNGASVGRRGLGK